MLNAISSFFDSFLQQEPGAPAPDADRLHLAAAALMLEIAEADHSFDEPEKQALLRILETSLQLDQATLARLWELARAERKEATSLYQFTSLLNASWSHDEKVRLLRQLWQVAYADGRIDRYEEHLIRKIGDLLYLTHGDFIRAKLAASPITP
jgi:uncharacterized tellurite resistance protein B-like protein